MFRVTLSRLPGPWVNKINYHPAAAAAAVLVYTINALRALEPVLIRGVLHAAALLSRCPSGTLVHPNTYMNS